VYTKFERVDLFITAYFLQLILTLPFSMGFATITIEDTFCSQIILQKSTIVVFKAPVLHQEKNVLLMILRLNGIIELHNIQQNKTKSSTLSSNKLVLAFETLHRKTNEM
jgi:hypothetical protein